MKKSKKILIIIGVIISVVLGIVCGMMASDLKGDIFPKSESSMDVNIDGIEISERPDGRTISDINAIIREDLGHDGKNVNINSDVDGEDGVYLCTISIDSRGLSNNYLLMSNSEREDFKRVMNKYCKDVQQMCSDRGYNIGIALNVLNDTETGSYKKKNIMYTSLNGKTCYDILEQGELEMTITDKK